MRIFILIALILTLSVSLVAQSTLNGVVTDVSGGAIAGAVIVIHWDSSGSKVGLHSNVGIKEDLVVRTGANGDFSVNLPPGFYDVFISSMAFTPVCRKVRLNAGSTVTFDPKLRLDVLVSAELAHPVF